MVERARSRGPEARFQFCEREFDRIEVGTVRRQEAEVNPTLTIMALAVRSCDFLLQEMKRGEL